MAPKLTWLFLFNRNNFKFYITCLAKESLIFALAFPKMLAWLWKTGLFNCCRKDGWEAGQIGEGGVRGWGTWGKSASPKLLFLKFACLLNSSIYKSYWMSFWPSPFFFPVESVMDALVEDQPCVPWFCMCTLPYERQALPSPWHWTHIVKGILKKIAKPRISWEVGSQIPIRNIPGNTYLYLLNK